ncbi:MAG: GIY-YIG nuclease family protein [Rickettsiales bacterium]|nr:GIY-YIG nuclease family protein [Rickettsiales bacterium]
MIRKISFEEMIARAPRSPGVYKMFDSKEKLLYVGKAKDLSKRLRQYVDLERLEYHKIIMRRQVARVEWRPTETESDALILEQRSIKTERPKYNIILKDDKMYPFLALSKGRYPRLYKFRDKMMHEARARRNIFGPFPFVSDLNETIKLVQKVAQVRTCADSVFESRRRPCLFYQTGMCSAPCCLKPDYTPQVRLARSVLRGHIRAVVSDLVKKMRAASAARDYESAAKYRGQIESLQSTTKIARILESEGKK